MILHSLEETRELAALLVERTAPGDLLLLAGPLGAGKTTLTSLIAEELNSDAQVSSPTYTLVHEYPTPAGLLVHIDAFRLADHAALNQLGPLGHIGLDDYLDRARLVVVEWGEALAKQYPEAWLVRLERDGERREASIRPPNTPAGG